MKRIQEFPLKFLLNFSVLLPGPCRRDATWAWQQYVPALTLQHGQEFLKKFLLLWICLLSFTTHALSKPIGTVLSTVNQVKTENRTLTRGSTLYTGDTIITGAKSSAQIKYLNGTLITIHANSRYQTLAYEPNHQLSLKSKLSPGAIEYTSNGKKKSMLQTPVVALAIEGTQFRVIATKQTTWLDVSEGLVIGNGVKVGPEQQFSSGSFDSKGHFTPGNIPWEPAVQDEISTAAPDKLDANTTMEATEIMPRLVEDNAMNATAGTIEALFTDHADIAFVF